MENKFKILISTKFEKDLNKLFKKEKSFFLIFETVVVILKNNPLQNNRVKKLKDVKKDDLGQWRIRVGQYRFRFDVDKNKIILKFVGLRRDSYR